MKDIKEFINESHAEDHLDFQSMLDDFLKDTDKKDWNTAEIYDYFKKSGDFLDDEIDEFIKWVLKTHKNLIKKGR